MCTSELRKWNIMILLFYLVVFCSFSGHNEFAVCRMNHEKNFLPISLLIKQSACRYLPNIE
jgi:hypothetical protein